jgi:hypothetical protein
MRDRIAERHASLAGEFAHDVRNHKLEIRHDDGLYRHLRCQKPKNSEYWFDVVTWPGSLTVRGDITDAYTFTREPDMFGFFRSRSGRINADYWAEKLGAGRSSAKQFSEDVFAQRVWADVRAEAAEYPGLAKAVHAEFFDDYACIGSPSEAYAALERFEYVPSSRLGFQQPFRFDGAWGWDLTDWDAGFLRGCHAIVWAIRQYDEAKSAAPVLAGVR